MIKKNTVYLWCLETFFEAAAVHLIKSKNQLMEKTLSQFRITSNHKFNSKEARNIVFLLFGVLFEGDLY